MRRLGAVATFVWDTNWHPSVLSAGGAPLEQWGGAAYSLAALSAACPSGWEIVPIAKVGADLADGVRRHLDGLPNLATADGIRVVAEPNNRVELRYRDAAHRAEILTGGVPPWSWAELAPIAATLDAIYLNYLSGYELDLEATRELRAGFAGLVYGDLHSLFLGPPSGDARPPRPLAHWEEWVACMDVVQLNETELALLGGGVDPERLLPEILALGPRLVVVTLGGRGARYATATSRGVVPAPLGELPGDPTGCGDVFGSALLAGLLDGGEIEPAIERAQRLAAAKMANPDTAALHATLAAAAAAGGADGG